MKKINKSRFAILGMLFEKPRSGYEIRQFMLSSTNHFWQESDASIYPMLKLLEKEKKVISKSEFTGKRERKIFEITQTGKDELLTWMIQPAEEENNRNELLLKIFLGAAVPKEETIKQLVIYQQKALDTKKRYKKVENEIFSEGPSKHQHKLFWTMSLRYGILHNEAELKWLTECFEILKKG